MLESEPGQQGSESQIVTLIFIHFPTYMSSNYLRSNLFDFFVFRMYQSQKKSKEALPHYQEALEYIESSRGEKSLECVPILRELAGVEQALGLHDASVNHFLQVSCNLRATRVLLDQLVSMDMSGRAAQNAWFCCLLWIRTSSSR